MSVKQADITGRVIFTREIGYQPAGLHRFEFSVDNLVNNGVYFYTITGNNQSYTGKFIVNK